MAGLYIHIPFCRNKCAYCDFFSLPLGKSPRNASALAREYCDAILREFDMRASEVEAPFLTVYVGGGTPTAMPPDILLEFIAALGQKVASHNSLYGAEPIGEFTIEANPEDIAKESIDAMMSAGINRVSIGIQSFDSVQLDSIGRIHDARRSLSALQALAASGINYSADLIYGLPGQSVNSWSRQLQRLLEYRPPHFSAYLLSYEPGTKLYARRQLGRVTEADEETASAMYGVLVDASSKCGYNHYEISNFALPGKEARHNSSYWDLTPYLGLGCSAHSFDGNIRSLNPSNLKAYVASLTANPPRIPAIAEHESHVNKINDYIITSLRTAAGLSLPVIESRWGCGARHLLENNMVQFKKNGRIAENHLGNLIIPEKHWLTADAILREVILDPDDIF